MQIFKDLRKDRKWKWQNQELKLSRINKLRKDKNWGIILIVGWEYHSRILIRLIVKGKKHCRVVVRWKRREERNLGRMRRNSCKNL